MFELYLPQSIICNNIYQANSLLSILHFFPFLDHMSFAVLLTLWSYLANLFGVYTSKHVPGEK